MTDTFVVNFTFDGVSGFPVNAGRYALTARIDDECYDGTVEAEFVIRQAEAYIEVRFKTAAYKNTTAG